MILNDNSTNTDFLYLYVEKFDWVSQVDSEQFNGHPKTKAVYRAIYNKDTKGYRIIYSVSSTGEAQAFIIDKLVSENEENGFTCKITPITRQNMLGFDIDEKDLDKLLFWTETDNLDLKKIMVENEKKPTQKQNNTIIDIRDVDPAVGEFFICAMEARDVNPLLFDAIHELMHNVIETTPDDTSVDTTWISLSKKHGTGANISRALESIALYAGENRRTNLDTEDLFQAIKHLLNEYIQRQFNAQ